MKPVVIKIVIGVAGFLGGFGAGFFCHKKMNDVKFEEVSEEEMQAIENSLLSPSKADFSASGGTDDQGVKKAVVEPSDALGAAQKLPEDTDELRNALQGKLPYIQADKEAKIAYERLWQTTKDYSNEENANNLPVYADAKPEDEDEADSEAPGEEDFDSDFLEQIEQEAAEAGNNFVKPPYLIDLASFWNERPEYDKITIHWYEPDNVWLDEHEDIIQDIASYVGTNVDLFKKKGKDDDEDIRFVRNERVSTDYEVIRHHRSYEETVGIKSSRE